MAATYVPRPVLAAAPRAEPPACTGSASHTLLVIFRRVDLLSDKEEHEGPYAERYTASATAYVASGVSGAGAAQRGDVLVYLVVDLRVHAAARISGPLRYRMLIVSTGWHWTTRLLSCLAVVSLLAKGIEKVITFFGRAMGVRAACIQKMPDKHRDGSGGGAGGRALS
ncbi:hypothetical protein WOLCODRAFT_156611 [Wolfiporia cocos MD-104 SS10]|uniref:Uncharacterized protein n=1 Tax=Wolfiporia cocos (strain MD-104) TaxID=742152 RepID=A0A2H3J2H1_WOLCO|nr:hypothetical protein WOLCODRAFT_156611 [Wolfiporia cocos MD-104 SS10]